MFFQLHLQTGYDLSNMFLPSILLYLSFTVLFFLPLHLLFDASFFGPLLYPLFLSPTLFSILLTLSVSVSVSVSGFRPAFYREQQSEMYSVILYSFVYFLVEVSPSQLLSPVCHDCFRNDIKYLP